MSLKSLDPQCLEVLRLLELSAPIGPSNAETARAVDLWRKQNLADEGPSVFDTRRVSIPAETGTIGAVVYRPNEAIAPGVLVWIHGGGWVAGSPDTVDDMARTLAVTSGCVVVSVDYSLAPEHPFPAGLMDCRAAVEWAATNSKTLGAKPNRLAVGGDSAGGNLAAAVTLLARDQGGPAIDFQLLVYPVTCRDAEVESRERYAEGFWLTAEMMRWNWDNYLDRDDDAANAYASPLLAESLAGLPPACILLADCDVLHDEGILYANRLRDHGVAAEVRTYEGMLHGFLACARAIDAGRTALRDGGKAVHAALAGASDGQSQPQMISGPSS
jgi:acetyl esterase